MEFVIASSNEAISKQRSPRRKLLAMTLDESMLPKIDPAKEKQKITEFIRETLEKQGVKNVVLALSGGIDSTTSLYLLKNSLPRENILLLHLPYENSEESTLSKMVSELGIPKENFRTISIRPAVEQLQKELEIGNGDSEKIRLGNIMARVRMIILYDFSKKHSALVCGTENRSEYHLGYFTRFGDEASDLEPLQHLYKTQVYDLAKYLGVPQAVVEKKPSAGLWHGQTDEGEFGFSYRDADPVLYLYFDKKTSIEKIEEMRFPNARKIIDFAVSNEFKHKVPYSL